MMLHLAKRQRPVDRPTVPSEDVAWIAKARLPFDEFAVGSLVPVVFERYARVFHPAWAPSAAQDSPLRWDTVAGWSGRTMHALAQWGSLSHPVDDASTVAPFAAPPGTGGLPSPQLAALCRVLAAHTGTPADCFIGVWEGSGWPVETWAGPAVLHLENRDYLVRRGPLSLAVDVGWRPYDDRLKVEPPSLLWPADRAWFAASDPDLDSTYLGGSSAAIDALLGQAELEAWPIAATDRITVDSDAIND